MDIKDFLISAACFDPLFLKTENIEFDKFYNPLFTSKNFEKKAIQTEFLVYKSLADSQENKINDVISFWKNNEKKILLAANSNNFFLFL